MTIWRFDGGVLDDTEKTYEGGLMLSHEDEYDNEEEDDDFGLSVYYLKLSKYFT